MTEQPIEVSGEIAIKVSTGDVCMQWSRLEIILIHLICTIEPMEMEKGYIVYGGLDILPRIHMAINLARENKLLPPIIKKIEAIRTDLQSNLLKRRNQVVHGAWRGDVEGAETIMTMVRWKGDQRNQKVSAIDIADLARQIHELGNKAHDIQLEIIERAIGKHVKEDLGDDLRRQ